MEDVRPLPVYPWPISVDDLESIKQAKIALNLPFKILPRPAVSGSPGRVLALREKFKQIHDQALVKDPSNPKAMLAALEWCLHPDLVDERATTVFDQLAEIMPGIVELESEVIESKVRFQ